MDTQELKGVTLLDILCLFYGVLLGFYIGICKQYNYEQELQCTTQGNGLSNSEAKHINYDRFELLKLAKYRKLTGYSNEDIKRIKLLNLRQSFRGKKGNKRVKWDVNRGVHHELLCALPKEKIKYENSKLLTLATANCQSIHNKIDELLATMIEDKIDICIITETWFNDSEASKRKLEEVKAILKQAEYIILNINRPGRGGGVGIIYRQNLQIRQLDGLVQDALEMGLWKLTIANKVIHIMGIYHPPKSNTNNSTMNKFQEELSDYLTKNINNYEELIIMGDTNIHYDSKAKKETIAYEELLYSFGLQQLVNCPTHRSGHCIDHIITKNNSKLGISEPTTIWEISDHWVTTCVISITKPKISRKECRYRKIKDLYTKEVGEDLQTMTRASKEIEDENLPIFYNTELSKIMEKHAPEKTKIITLRPEQKWMSEDLKNLKRKVRSIERKYKTNNKPEVKQEYKTQKLEYKKLLQKTKKEYINEKFMKCGSNTKKLYKTLNQIIGKNKEVTLPPGKDMDCANNLLNYFMDKIKKINENLENYELFTPPSNSSNHKLEEFREISADEVKRIIMESKPTTCGSDPIPSTVVKHHLDILVPILTRLINWSLRTGSFHKTWKKSIITPLQKKVGQDTGYTNYRPVNNLPFLSKITEKAMIQQLNQYLETHCPLPDTTDTYVHIGKTYLQSMQY